MHNCSSCCSVILPEEHVTRLGNGEYLCSICGSSAELLKLRPDPLIDELVRALGELAPRDVLEVNK